MSADEALARVRESFARQELMRTLGASLGEVARGEVEIVLPVTDRIGQQHGFVHAGAVAAIADSACGYACLTLMPEASAVLSVEFKVNLTAPARGDRLLARARCVRPGRTLSVAQAEVHAESGESRRLVALMQGTMMRVDPREGGDG